MLTNVNFCKLSQFWFTCFDLCRKMSIPMRFLLIYVIVQGGVGTKIPDIMMFSTVVVRHPWLKKILPFLDPK